MARAVKAVAANGGTQIVYYHPGVGTGNGLDHLIGGGTGVGLSRNVRDAYAFIINNYLPGDEIFIFGFSRGAYTARSLAGLLGVIGILPEQRMGDFMDAWAYFKLRPESRKRHEPAFEQRFSGRLTKVRVRCIGVWDTVGAMGIPVRGLVGKLHPCRRVYQFLNVELGAHIEHAFQALAIDEKRGAFDASVWMPRTDRLSNEPEQVVRQVWFAGVHSDCGGGYPDHGASDLAFAWMAAQVSPLLELDETSIEAELDRRQKYNQDELHETMNLKWRLLGPICHRAVGRGLNETVHGSVIARLDGGKYKPYQATALRDMAVEPATPLEARLSWSGKIARKEPTPLIVGRPRFCDRVVRWLGGG
jgi:uncharacterized protein (DUF2235 family)